MPTRRSSLASFQFDNAIISNASLWLDKYISDATKSASRSKTESERAALVREVSTIQHPEEYKAFFDRWTSSLNQLGAQTVQVKTSGKNRIAVGLGIDSVLETSISLHRTWGVPYIPGSALKGLASSYAHQKLGEGWRKGESFHLELFGSTKQNGAITFFDALPNPNANIELLQDVMTPHHSEYYNGDEPKPPADWDSPIPVPFLSARGVFLIALAPSSHHLENPTQALELAHSILKKALMEFGIGAKTSSGYGRLGKVKKSAAKDSAPTVMQPIELLTDDLPQSNPNDKKALSYLELARTDQLYQYRFTQNPSDLVSQFLNLAASCTASTRVEVAQGFIDLIKEVGKESNILAAIKKQPAGKTHWYERLLEAGGLK
jgi:CRISPR-associated protein Cmr6